jgi:predicted 3-demethylubiquinone-9 3-methyltransferase (glyoxalase superfamily)
VGLKDGLEVDPCRDMIKKRKAPTAGSLSLSITRRHDNEAEEHDLPLVQQGRPRGGELLRRSFPDSKVTAVNKAPGDYPGGKAGDVLVVEFTVVGIPCIGLNGGPEFKHSEAFSFQIATENQEETDRYWNAIVGNGGMESQCGWCKDRWGLSWQITPRVLTEAMAAGGAEAKRAFEAMMPMKKIDVATIEAARRG